MNPETQDKNLVLIDINIRLEGGEVVDDKLKNQSKMQTKMKIPKISIIIPCHNSEKTLAQCLNSILNQNYKNYEAILINNKSIDNTKKIIKQFQKKSNKIKYLFEAKIGRGKARNTGERRAKGQIILMTDSDCIVPKNWIKQMTYPIIKNKSTAVQGFKESVIKNYWTLNLEKQEKNNIKKRLKDKKIGLLDTANFAIKKSVLKKIGYSNPNLKRGNDTELEARLKLNNHKLVFQNISVKHYHPNTVIKVIKKYLVSGYYNKKIRKFYKNNKKIFDKPQTIPEFFKHLSHQFLDSEKNFKYNFITGISWRLGNLTS